jgi:nitrite reductase/ring-hydroxylating ferredoxin subunit
MSWKDLSSAPIKGAFIANVIDVPEGASTLNILSTAGEFPMILVRRADRFFAYVNACPHQFLPLDYRGPQILSAAGDQLMCTSHGAKFSVETGVGTAGHGLGCSLDSVPLETTSDGRLLIG